MKLLFRAIIGVCFLATAAFAGDSFQFDQRSYEATKDFLNTKIKKFDLKSASIIEAIRYLFFLANRQHPNHEQGFLFKTDSNEELKSDIDLKLNDISVYDILTELLSISKMKVSFEDGRFVFSPQKAQQDAAANP